MIRMFQMPGARLDASESMFVQRELEAKSAQVYRNIYAALQARGFIPTEEGIPDWAKVWTWSEMDEFGKAKIISQAGDDLPRVDVAKTQKSKFIKTVGAAYGYSWEEMRAAAAMGTPLDSEKANLASFAVDSEVDALLAYGASAYNMEGLLTLSGTTAFAPLVKAAGGTAWGTLTAPKATGAEVAADLMGIATKAYTASKGKVLQVNILLPTDQYAYAAQQKISSFSETTALDFARSKCPFIAGIDPWWRCNAADSNWDGSGAKLSIDTMIAYPKDKMFLAGMVPMEKLVLPAQQKNLEWVVPVIAKTGGVLARMPQLVFVNNAPI